MIAGVPLWDVILSGLPIVLLVHLMTKKDPVPSYLALPVAAAVYYLFKLVYFEADPNLVNATVVSGLLTAWTPILIIWGAIFFFRTMEYSGAMDVIRQWLNEITTRKVGQLMLIAWAFGFLVEGASGFGTPAALCAPLLVGLGFTPVRVAIVCLVMNSVPVTFGAVGTPTWFGLGELDLPHNEVLHIGFLSALIHSVAGLVIPVIALLFVVPAREVRKNILFVMLSIVSCVIPYLALSFFDYEFPAILGGGIGLVVTAILARKNIGMQKESDARRPERTLGVKKLVYASFPLWGTIILLLATRIKYVGLKELLLSKAPFIKASLGSLGTLSVSKALVVKLDGIFNTSAAWTNNFLFIPSIIPFFLISVIAFFVFRMKHEQVAKTWRVTFEQIKKPILALSGALVFVKLMSLGGESASTQIIGRVLAEAAGDTWQFFAAYLGALGSFFAGSNTVSNLTFGPIQISIADKLGLDASVVLALQSVGGAMGNMVCIHNIVAVCSVLGINDKEGFILKRTVVPMIIYGVIAGLMGCLLLALR